MRSIPIFENDELITVERHANIIQYRSISAPVNNSFGYCISSKVMSKIQQTENIFQCTPNGEYILAEYLCDGIVDCLGNEKHDEAQCKCQKDSTNNMKHCQVFTSQNELEKCGPLYSNENSHSCKPYTIYQRSSSLLSENISEYFSCENGKNISLQLVNDLVFDCGNNGEDEFLLKTYLLQETFVKCNKSYQIPCREGHPKCFNILQICVFLMDEFNNLDACRTGEHLQECKNFKCNIWFKCPEFYCIPWKYTLDGKWDCPQGKDEATKSQYHSNRNCSSLFRCRKSIFCIHIVSLCDGVSDCPFKDDEKLCSLKSALCPLHCECLTFAIHCKNVSIVQGNLRNFIVFKVIHFVNAKINHFGVPYVVKLSILESKFSLCDLMLKKDTLESVAVSHNQIAEISSKCFSSKKIHTIDLSHNNLTILPRNTFFNLPQLKNLNLSHNPLTYVSTGAFTDLPNLKILSFQGATNIKASDQIFKNTKLHLFQVDDHKLCCLATESECSAMTPWYFSCSDLLASNGLKITLYVIGGTTVFANILSLISLVMPLSTFDNSFVVLVCSVNITDLISVLPFLLLCIFDVIYRGIYSLIENQWRSSSSCYIILSLFLDFSFISPVLLCLYTFTRFMVIEHPLTTELKEKSFVAKIILGIVVVSSCCTALCSTLTWITAPPDSNGLPMVICSPFVDPENLMIMTKVMAWFTVLLQYFSAIFILVVYIMLFRSLVKSQKNVEGSVSRKMSNVPLVVQIIVLTSSNILCWIPSGTIFLTAMFMTTYPLEMITWTTIAVTPINSIVNPVVFIVTTVRKLIGT